MNYFSKSVSLALATTLVAASIHTASAEDKYLRSLEDRIAALEAEVNTTQSDAKGKKGVIESPAIPVYVTPKSKYVEQMKLRGRAQFQFGETWGHGRTAGSHGSYNTMELRRVRIGVEGKIMDDFRFLVEANILPGAANLNEAYLQWTAIEFFQPLVGYVKPRFGYEEITSSAKILTVERSRITNQFATAQLTGAVIEGQYSFFNYSLGVFNGVPNGTITNPARPADQNYLYNASVGLDFSEMTGFPLEFRADYMNINSNVNGQGFNTNASKLATPFTTNNLRHNIDLSMRVGAGPFDLRAEWYYGFEGLAAIPRTVKDGADSEDLWGVIVTPSVYLIPDKLQLVARYQYGSSGFLGFRPVNRYERRAITVIPGATRFWALYGGLNYYIHGDDLKLMLGYEYSEQDDGRRAGLGDYSANTVFAAVRMQF